MQDVGGLINRNTKVNKYETLCCPLDASLF